MWEQIESWVSLQENSGLSAKSKMSDAEELQGSSACQIL